MKNTFLVLNDPKNPKSGLRVATSAEWDQILKANKELPREQRRFFITDSFEDCGEIDRMYIETTQEEYNKWHAQEMRNYRKNKWAEDASIVSLSEPISSVQEELELEDTISNGLNIEEHIVNSIMLGELSNALGNWNEWAVDLLEYCLRGQYSSCTKELVGKWAVSKTVVAKRKRQFISFVKNFLS